MAALKRRIDGKDNSMEEDQFILQNVQKKVNFELHVLVVTKHFTITKSKLELWSLIPKGLLSGLTSIIS